jgi:hypothetical protein
VLPRIFALDRALTVDEAYFWQQRSAAFLAALTSGRFADTMITGHPGVTTMWLGSAGLLLEQALQSVGLIATPSAPLHLALVRLPLATATALAVPAGYLLLRRVLGERIALIAALLWATDPFLIAHSRLVHVDAVLTMLMLVSTLALLAACFGIDSPRERPGKGLLLLAGAMAGLALLTKAPGVLLFPSGALIFAVWCWQRRGAAPGVVVLVARGLLLWGGAALLTAFIAWPALWVAPVRAISSVVGEVLVNGGTSHPHNFLLGSNDRDPGMLFYAVTLLGRTTPWAALGLIALIVAALRGWRPAGRTPLLLLACAALCVLLALTFVPKKFDRYALPAVPPLLTLAACGLFWLGTLLPQLLRRGAGMLVAAAAVVTLLILHPYYLAYYSPLIGGGRHADDIVPIGEGEGLDAAAAWLETQPDLASSVVVAWSPPIIQPYLRTTVERMDALKKHQADYLVVYIRQVQTGSMQLPECPPLHTVRIYGIEYAWIYWLPRTIANPLSARFGDAVALDGYSLTPPNTSCSDHTLSLTLSLQPLARPQQPAMFFIHVIGLDGRRIAQFDVPLDNLIPPSDWQNSGGLSHTLKLPIAAEAPPGTYHVTFGIYDAASGARLRLAGANVTELDGSNALHVATFDLR